MLGLDAEKFKKIVLAGFFGELVFETYAWLISPLLFGPTLQPARLVTAIVTKVTGVVLPYGPAFAIHSLTGTVFFALLVFFMQKITGKSYIFAGFLTGLVLWFIAQGILAPFVGRTFMMSFGAYTQSSFVAHTGMMLMIGFALSKLMAPQTDTDPDTSSE